MLLYGYLGNNNDTVRRQLAPYRLLEYNSTLAQRLRIGESAEAEILSSQDRCRRLLPVVVLLLREGKQGPTEDFSRGDRLYSCTRRLPRKVHGTGLTQNLQVDPSV